MHQLVKAVEDSQKKEEIPNIMIGDRVRVHLRIREGQRQRIQVFEGNVIARKGHGVTETITVRRVSYGVGVERVFMLHSPLVETLEVVSHGKVRRAKLYYLRGRTGRSARIRERLDRN